MLTKAKSLYPNDLKNEILKKVEKKKVQIYFPKMLWSLSDLFKFLLWGFGRVFARANGLITSQCLALDCFLGISILFAIMTQ